jgi:CheY-like chemotaxis protein
VTEQARKVLEMSRLTQVFDTHESEEKAVAAFYRSGAPAGATETPVTTGRSILCVDYNRDVLAYLRELLHRAGYDVQSTSHPGDALILMRITNFDLLLAGPELPTSPSTRQAFQVACTRLPVIELGSEFSTRDAGEAGAALLQEIESRLNPKTA